MTTAEITPLRIPKRGPQRRREPTGQPLPRLIPSVEAARQIGISKSGMYDLLKGGEITSYRIGTGWQVDQDSLLDYLERRRVQPEVTR